MTQQEIKTKIKALTFCNSIIHEELEHIEYHIEALHNKADERKKKLAENIKNLDDLQQQLQEPKTIEA